MAVDNRETIERLERLAASGARSITIGGETTTYRSLADIYKAIDRLKAQDTVNGYTKRNRARNVDLSRSFG